MKNGNTKTAEKGKEIAIANFTVLKQEKTEVQPVENQTINIEANEVIPPKPLSLKERIEKLGFAQNLMNKLSRLKMTAEKLDIYAVSENRTEENTETLTICAESNHRFEFETSNKALINEVIEFLKVKNTQFINKVETEISLITIN